jgi:hypothetical protein
LSTLKKKQTTLKSIVNKKVPIAATTWTTATANSPSRTAYSTASNGITQHRKTYRIKKNR